MIPFVKATLLALLLCACGPSQPPVRRSISRLSTDPAPWQVVTPSPCHVPYPWNRWDSPLLPITAAHFQCRGESTHPFKEIDGTYYADCRGAAGHSLPLIGGEPGVYPILIELLNHLQADFERPVHITCGHRCPTHNTYADPSKRGQTSKHMIGAEVDFYVEGLEWEPERVVESLIAFYQKAPAYRDKAGYAHFVRYEKQDTDVATPPWYNKEVFIKLYREGEGRDGDNQHPYPYVAIQVRHDGDKGVAYSWQAANNNFLRE